MENSHIMHFGNEESSIDEAANNWYSLNEHYKLSELESPIEFRRHHLEISNHYAIPNAVANAQHQHPKIPLKFIVSVVGELKIELNHTVTYK